MILIIVATDQFIWRPLIAWSDKFKFEQVESSKRVSSPVLHLLTHSQRHRQPRPPHRQAALRGLYRQLAHRRTARLHQLSTLEPDALAKPSTAHQSAPRRPLHSPPAPSSSTPPSRPCCCSGRSRAAEYLHIAHGALITFLRVNVSLLLAAAWTIPVGVAIGFNPRLAKIAQPIAQIAASVPATALFPILLLALVRIGGGIGIGSIALMLLGTQWYILFNVIAGAMAIPSDLKEVATLFRFSRIQRWKTVILPGIFPFLITGMVTASGGAWNASIFAEYFSIQGRILQTTGLGAQINAATSSGQFAVLLLCTMVMSLMVVTTNRLVWRRLFRLAETRYKLEG